MRFLILIAPKDFKDESLAMVKLFFNRWNIEYRVGSYSRGECEGYHGAVYKPDVNANDVRSSDYDGLMIIDGSGIESSRMYEYRPLLDMILLFNNSNRYICAMGNAVKIIARANVIKDKKIAMPADEDTARMVVLFHGIPSKEKIEIDKNIITIRDSNGLDESLPKMLQRVGVI
jgi:protease I